MSVWKSRVEWVVRHKRRVLNREFSRSSVVCGRGGVTVTIKNPENVDQPRFSVIFVNVFFLHFTPSAIHYRIIFRPTRRLPSHSINTYFSRQIPSSSSRKRGCSSSSSSRASSLNELLFTRPR